MKLFIYIGLLCLLFLPFNANAMQLTFTEFSVDLPEEWTYTVVDNTTAFASPQQAARVQVTVEHIKNLFTEGIKAQELAELYAQELQGSEPRMVDGNSSYYSFTFISPTGQESEASIVVSGSRFYLITISGNHAELVNVIESILISIS